MKTKTIRVLSVAIALAFLSGCAHIFGDDSEDDMETVNKINAGNDTVSVVLTPKSFVAYKNIENAEAAREECFKANGAMPTDRTAQALREMRLATAGAADCGAGYNDAIIAKAEEKTKRTQTRWGTTKSVITTGIIGTVADRGISTIAGAVKSGFDNAGNKVEVDNGSTYNGAQGNSTYNEDNSGIKVEPIEADTLTIGQPVVEEEEPVEEEAVCELRELFPGEEPVDLNGDGLVCSDGEGGVSDN